MDKSHNGIKYYLLCYNIIGFVFFYMILVFLNGTQPFTILKTDYGMYIDTIFIGF